MDNGSSTMDSMELEALFDSVASASEWSASAPRPTPAPPAAVPATAARADSEEFVSRVGRITRALHDSLRELGYDKLLEKAAHAIPDARDRLAYVVTMTEQAAERTLNAIDVAKPLQQQLESGATALSQDWQRLFDGALSISEFQQLVERTRGYLDGVPQQTRATNEQLLEIMMAQDFQDLTGQVIRKITDLAHNLEQQLVELLVDNAGAGGAQRSDDGLLNGPVIRSDGRSDVVTSQHQVDELLESLGF